MNSDSKFLTTDELADRWRVTPQTLRRWRSEGREPPFYRIQGTALYKLADVKQYEQASKNQPDH